MVETMAAAYLSAGSALLGAAVGGIISYLANRRFSNVEAKRQSMSIAAAIRSEISTHLQHAHEGNYVSVWEDCLKDIKLGNDFTDISLLLVYRQTFPVFHSTANQIGLMPPVVAEKVVKFITLAEDAMKTSLAMPDFLKGQQQAQAANFIESHLRDMHAYLDAGRDAVDELEHFLDKCAASRACRFYSPAS